MPVDQLLPTDVGPSFGVAPSSDSTIDLTERPARRPNDPITIDLTRLEEAETLLRRSLESYQSALGADHPNVAVVRGVYADLLRETGRSDEADELLAPTGG